MRPLDLADFPTVIESEHGGDLLPFTLWPAQIQVADLLTTAPRVVLLKARQLGISWLLCRHVLLQALARPNLTVLMLSQGQLEADELIRRVQVLYHGYSGPARLPALTTDNTRELGWDNGARMLSLPATRRAGRSFTAGIVVLDEYAFMAWPREVLAAVKPTVDAGGQLVIVSTADAPGSAFHRLCSAAEAGANGYAFAFLPWHARPGRDAAWREARLRELGGDTAALEREYPSSSASAFTAAAGLIYADQWSEAETVTEAADYVPDAGPVLWGVDDGYAGGYDAGEGRYTPDSHPRVMLLAQLRADGRLCVFHESYAVGTLSEAQIDQVLALPYPLPDHAAIDSSAAELRGRLYERGIMAIRSTHKVEEGIKELRRGLAPDGNGWRRILVHPRCRLLRGEMANYAGNEDGVPVKRHDHGPDALRYLHWTVRTG